MKSVARGLENKIIELQQKLDEKVSWHNVSVLLLLSALLSYLCHFCYDFVHVKRSHWSFNPL